MSASVCVLTPNGRRSTIKCSPNTTVLQILEDVCKKHNLKPEEFDLKHHNKILDTTATFRFSGLPNNAQLEMVTATKVRSEGDITLAVNLENGQRLMGSFKPGDNLLSVLNSLCAEMVSEDKNPVVIYTRREIYGKELETVTLKSLGLTGGRAMIRLIHRTPEELKTQAGIGVSLPSKPAEEKPYVRKRQVSVDKPETAPEATFERLDHESADAEQKEGRPRQAQKGGNVDILKLAKEKRKSRDFAVPNEEKKLSLSDIPKPSEPPKGCECKADEAMELDCSGNCQKNCTNDENLEDQFVFLGERNAMLFSLETAQVIPSENLPDDFFDLTIDDARKLLRDVRRQTHHDDNKPLMTSALRNLEDSKRQLRQLSRYKKAIIRIQFPDRTVLQGTFAPSDTVESIIEFAREYLDDKSLRFYVYSTPPKEILEESKNLLELGFVPGALIHFGTDNLMGSRSYLRKDLQDKFTSNSVASLAASKMRSANTRKCENEEEDMDYEPEPNPTNAVNDGASTSTGITHDNYGERKVMKTTEKLPKWFKP